MRRCAVIVCSVEFNIYKKHANKRNNSLHVITLCLYEKLMTASCGLQRAGDRATNKLCNMVLTDHDAARSAVENDDKTCFDSRRIFRSAWFGVFDTGLGDLCDYFADIDGISIILLGQSRHKAHLKACQKYQITYPQKSEVGSRWTQLHAAPASNRQSIVMPSHGTKWCPRLEQSTSRAHCLLAAWLCKGLPKASRYDEEEKLTTYQILCIVISQGFFKHSTICP